MFRSAAFVLAVVAMQLLGAGVARADDPYRIVLSRVDPSDFPTVRLVASVVDANGKAVPGLRPQDLQVREGTVAPQANVTLAPMGSTPRAAAHGSPRSRGLSAAAFRCTRSVSVPASTVAPSTRSLVRPRAGPHISRRTRRTSRRFTES